MTSSVDQYLFGYLLSPPGPQDWGSAIDDVPDPGTAGQDLAQAHMNWRSRVESELASRLASGAISVWYPISVPTDQPILPLIGGQPTTDWRETVSVLIDQAFRSGQRSVRVIDLTQFGLWESIADDCRKASPSRRILTGVVAPSRTSSAILAGLDADGVVELIAEVLRADDSRQSRNDSVRQTQMLRNLAGCLQTTPTLTSLAQAAQYALTLDQTGVDLSDAELLALEQYHSRQVQNRRSKGHGLDDLELLLQQLAGYDRTANPTKTGTRKSETVSVRGISTGGSGVNHELASDLLAARLARELAALDRKPGTVTVVLGADKVSPPTLKTIRDAAISRRSRLFLFFEQFANEALDIIGAAGASIGGFFRLANNREAEAAAEFMGRQHRFELTGMSTGTSRSFEWGWSSTSGTDRSTSRSMDTGRLFSSTVSRSVSRSRSDTTSGGGSTGHTSGTEYSRVYEYLLEPTTFQGLPPGSLLMVDVATRAAAMVSCSVDVHQSKVASDRYVLELNA